MAGSGYPIEQECSHSLLPPVVTIWGSGLLFALTLRPGGLGSPQIGGFCGRAAFWGERWAISAFFHCVLPKKPYAPLQCFFPLFTPQKAISSLTVLFSTVCSPKSHIGHWGVIWWWYSGKKHCKGWYGFLGSTQWKKALIAHLSPQKAALPQKPPIWGDLVLESHYGQQHVTVEKSTRP